MDPLLAPQFATKRLFSDFKEIFKNFLAVVFLMICPTLEGEYFGSALIKRWKRSPSQLVAKNQKQYILI
jgi:hypothetical protein